MGGQVYKPIGRWVGGWVGKQVGKYQEGEVIITLVEIGQNVTILFVTTCDYQLFVTTFGHFYNYFFCWSYL